MTHMYEVAVKHSYLVNGIHLPAGLSVRVATPFFANPLNSQEGKIIIAKAYLMQCGLDLTGCIQTITSAHFEAFRLS